MSSDVITGELRIATAGIDLIAEALIDQSTIPTIARWRPPSDPSLAPVLSAIALSDAVTQANEEALSRLTSARPHLVGIEAAANAVALEKGTFLHAGPPITWERASGPMRGALIGAALLEYPAETPESAGRRFECGEFKLEPCHHRRAVGPMAGVVSSSMPMFVIEDSVTGRRAYCTLNEGLGKVLRFGAYSDEVLDRLKWMGNVLAPVLNETINVGEPIDLFAMASEALQMGDECHNRNRAATSLFLRAIGPRLIDSARPSSDVAACFRFISSNDHFFLNLMMPAGKVTADSARNIRGSTIVVAMARNGTDFGIQLSGTGDEWFTGPCAIPEGLLFPGYGPDDANPDIGDSTITETAGAGGFAMAAAPAIVKFVGGTSALALDTTRAMYDITVGEHPLFRLPALDFRGTPVGIDAALVCRTGLVPAVNTGIAGKQAGVGQVGAGLVEPPMECFNAALRRYGVITEEWLSTQRAQRD
ncbi:MAG: DUF1116 domain-containing protein [Gammaproteobacteria bacterium]|nr:DUF1116 domain-containing protein [Gammaproteobacteria bacterium]